MILIRFDLATICAAPIPIQKGSLLAIGDTSWLAFGLLVPTIGVNQDMASIWSRFVLARLEYMKSAIWNRLELVRECGCQRSRRGSNLPD